MKTVLNFLEKYGLILIFVLILVQTCVSSSNKRISEKKNMSQLDSIKIELKNLKESLKKEIKIEGLNSELRMIESTDRRMMDKNRQSEIREELKQIQK